MSKKLKVICIETKKYAINEISLITFIKGL